MARFKGICGERAEEEVLLVRLIVVVASLVAILCSIGSAQNQPTSDSQALSYAAQAITALAGATTISDVTLTGSATWIAGADIETGPATLYAKGASESRSDLNLTAGMRTDIRNDTAGFPQGASSLSGGPLQAWALHNCWINASWFFPALSFLSTTSDPALVFSYIGQETRGSGIVQHIQVYRYLNGQKANTISLTRQVSTMDVYLDANSLLPVAYVFNTHPDDDATTNIPSEVDFSNYQSVGGVQVPFHIQKFIQGSLAVDITVTGATFNSSLPDSLFVVQ